MSLTRRKMLARTGAMGGAALLVGSASAAVRSSLPKPEDFRYCLNTSTIRGQRLPLPEVIDIAAKAGYDALEPWIGEVDGYVKSGGSLKDLDRRIRDLGLTVESAIGFAEWIVEDDARRAKGMEGAKRDMDLVAQIGGRRIAAPPAGATDTTVDLLKAAERYRALLELGDRMGVVPQAEVWGFSRSLSRLGETALVAIESGHPKACILPDVYHLHRGGSDPTAVRLLNGTAIHVFHMNDYPADPPRERLTDGHRVYPGDGVAPLGALLRFLHDSRNGAPPLVLSLELFNDSYWKQDALAVVRTGLAKMKAAVKRSSTPVIESPARPAAPAPSG